MKSLIKVLVGILFIAFLVVSTQFLMLYMDDLRAGERKQYLDSKAKEIVAGMSTRNKIGQVIHLAIPGKTMDTIAIQEMKSIHPGGIIHFGKNFGTPSEIKKLNQDLQNLASKEGIPPLLISTDQEGGRVFRVREKVAQYPGAMAMGQTNDPDLGHQVGFVTSYDLNQLGVNFLLAPSLDVNNNPDNPVINTRSFGSDVQRVNTVAGAYEKGARLGGAIPVIKHFPGHGDTNVDSHLGLPVINKTLEELEELELIPFRNAIQSGAPVVMTAHILYPKIDDRYPTTLSKILLDDILRKRLGFEGVVITDAMEMHAISKNYQKEKPGVKALLAGADILLLTSWGESSSGLYKELEEAEKNGMFQTPSGNRLDEAVFRQIRLKLEYGVYTNNGISVIQNDNLASKMKEDRTYRENLYKEYTKDPEFVFHTTKKTIRSYPTSLDPKSIILDNTAAFLKRTHYIREWTSNKGKNLPLTSISQSLKNKNIQNIILDVYTQKEFAYASKLAKSHPDKKFILLYPGTPFITLPQEANITILLSFSITVDSYRSLVAVLFDDEIIPRLDLILKE
ncbi:MAG: glycoside hydrolase family 3 protein [Leptospira sp.]|nr:glycoside hydrolase family 3 protein [Leptospira sp.]